MKDEDHLETLDPAAALPENGEIDFDESKVDLGNNSATSHDNGSNYYEKPVSTKPHSGDIAVV